MPAILQATGQTPADFHAIQNAIDNPPPDGIIELHTNSTATPPRQFKLGVNEIVLLRQNVTLLGVDEGAPNQRAVIEGVERLQWGVKDAIRPDQPYPQVVKVSATIRNLTFKDFTFGMVLIVGGAGKNEIVHCSFENCKFGISPMNPALQGAFPVIVSPKTPAALTGTLVIKDCHFGASIAPSYLPAGMNNMVHVNDANLDLLEISDNVIEDMYWIGFDVWGVPGHTRIAHNDITRKSSFAKWPGVGIGFGLRTPQYGKNWDGRVTIEKNRVTIKSPAAPTVSSGSYGIAVFRYAENEYNAHVGWTDREVIVRDNVVKIEGANQKAALACIGACSSSVWTNNVVAGSAQYGILVSRDSDFGANATTGTPTNSVFEGNHFAGGTRTDPCDGQVKNFGKFTAFCAQVYVAADASQFMLKDNAFGPVSGSNWLTWPPPLNMPCVAGIACFGSDGQMLLNDFSTSDIEGWWHPGVTPPPNQPEPHVGCIYLDEQTCRNLVVYCHAEFPPGTVAPSVKRQILDVAQSEWASLTKPPGSENTIMEVKKVAEAAIGVSTGGH